MKQAFDQQSGGSRNLRNDLLVAADSVTSAMSSLVRELNSGKDDSQGAQGVVMADRDHYEGRAFHYQ